ncbi:hypothetical protein UFOVP784_60 [uncultured Caudovirales phage]|jgi:hypothetical protein|uniref:Uncharacterized protein n=1 Tax=uncultured Caudovirales phage TaxID=2100421 RepID=A0A6J5M8L3_9CAUD|nr:hypothetical protein UFOVP436_60 [uncultured Caudovirales phage]CAB4162549.1 hypothetical protein UFOVP784_60 [uncultured Caudovirales phage]
MSELQKPDSKNNFMKQFESLRPDLFFPEHWTDDQKEKAVDLIRPQKTRSTMFSSIPMNCEAEKCIFATTCPLMKENLAPRNKPCPIEMSMVAQFTAEYLEQLEVNPNNLVEVSMVRDLVDQEVQYLRKTKLLAKEHFVQENIIGVDQDGQPILKKELHLAVELEDKLHKRRKDLRNQLLATREAKAKVGQVQLDTAQAISDIIGRVQAVESQREKLLKQKLGTSELDDYIIDSEVIEDK